LKPYRDPIYDANDAEKLTALRLIYDEYGDLEAALDPLRRAAELGPQASQMQYNLAVSYYRLNRFEEARTLIADAVRRWPDILRVTRVFRGGG
jgi:Flp pilus assembly protein TadD